MMISFIIGMTAFIILMPVIEWACDNHGDINHNDEQKITDMYMGKL